jgi:hypothetical protein
MKKGVVCSRSLLVVAGVLFTLTCGLIWLRFKLKAELADRTRSDVATENALATQIAAMPGSEDEDLDLLRSKIDRIRLQLGDGLTWPRMVSTLGPQWQPQTSTWTEKSGASLRTEILERRNPELEDWPEIVSSVNALESFPGVSISDFEMRTSGSRENRTLDVTRVTLSIRSRMPSNSPSLRP